MSFSNNHEFVVSKVDKIIGMILVVGIVVGFFLYISYEKQNLQNQWLSLTAYTINSHNLTEGAEILLSGVNIGKIEQIDLAEDGRVQFTLLLDKQFQSFYVNDSTLSINSDFDINSIFGGSSLLFHKGISSVLLSENDTITIAAPQSVAKIFEEMNIQGLITRLSVIIDNLVDVSTALKDKKNNLDETISNINNATAAVNQASESLPLLLDASRLMVDDIRLSLAQVKPEVRTGLQTLQQTMADSHHLLEKFDILLDTMINASQHAPQTIESTNLTLIEIRALAQNLNNHWLIKQGQSDDGVVKPQDIPVVLPQDKSLYQESKTSQN